MKKRTYSRTIRREMKKKVKEAKGFLWVDKTSQLFVKKGKKKNE